MGRLIDTDTLKKAITQDWFLDILLTKNGKSEIKKPLIDMIDSLPKSYDTEKVIEAVRIDCYSMGFDESQTEIIVNDVRKGGAE